MRSSTQLSGNSNGNWSGAEASSSSESDGDACSSGDVKASGKWTADEHDRFLRAMKQFPIGPWSAIADIVRTRSVRQVHSHAQKYAAKVERHKRGQAKVRRNRVTGECEEPSGHRVVTQIPGKFMSYAATSMARQRVEDGDRNHDNASPTGHEVVHAIGSSTTSPVHLQPHIASYRDDRHTALKMATPALTQLSLDQSHRPEAPSLPSLDESLDFFFHHFADS